MMKTIKMQAHYTHDSTQIKVLIRYPTLVKPIPDHETGVMVQRPHLKRVEITYHPTGDIFIFYLNEGLPVNPYFSVTVNDIHRGWNVSVAWYDNAGNSDLEPFDLPK